MLKELPRNISQENPLPQSHLLHFDRRYHGYQVVPIRRITKMNGNFLVKVHTQQ